MKLRTQILLFLLLFALTPLIIAVLTNLPLVLERMELFYHKAHLQNLRADFRDLDQHLASRDEMVQLLAKLPEPGTVLGTDQQQEVRVIDKARAQYTLWINRILGGQLDIIELVFFDAQGNAQFWLERDKTSQEWLPTVTPPALPNLPFIQAALKAEPGNVLVSPISLNAEAGTSDPRRFMTLRLIGPIPDRDATDVIGAIMMVIDVGGIARSYHNTLWVHSNGHFLEHAGPNAPVGDASALFSGLKEIFQQGKPALWKGESQQIMWVPMFRTEQSGPLWVGRQVDPSPIAQFRNALTLRVLSIVFALAVAVWLAARWVARKAEHISRDLLTGVQRVLKDEERVSFDWHGPQELRTLGESLSRLAVEHGRNTRNLRAHARKLEESNRYKSQFLANVSHELRTPLNSILLLSKLLGDQGSGLTPDQKQQARVIHEAGRDLQTLINDILDLSRIEAQRTSFHLEWIDLPKLLESVIELVEPQFHDKQLPLHLEIADDAPRRIHSDPDKIRQIIKNFLSNALKFTERGAITLQLAGQKEYQDRTYELGISVTDKGIGIPADQQSHIFEAFRQADGSTSRRYGGSGLGLTISQQLAHLLGGDIALQSKEGNGSTFTLLLPLEFHPQLLRPEPAADRAPEPAVGYEVPLEEEPTAVAEEREITGHRVLLVDDDLRSLLLLTPLLEDWGLEVTAAGDGEEALEVLEEDDDFSVVLMDIMMPGMDGYDTIRSIRNRARFHELAIIALTAKTGDDDRVACLEAGADDFLSKPVDTEELRQIIARHLPFIDT